MRASILRIVHPAPVVVEVLEAPAAPAARDPGARAVGSAQSCHVPHSLPARQRFRLAARRWPTSTSKRRGTGPSPSSPRPASSTCPAPPLLEDELDRLAAEPELSTVVLDLRQLEFMDSSGLRLVVLADMRAREAGPPLRAGQGRRDRAPRVRDHAHERAASSSWPTRGSCSEGRASARRQPEAGRRGAPRRSTTSPRRSPTGGCATCAC